MLRRRDDEHDLFVRRKHADAVDDDDGVEIPTGFGLVDDRLDASFGHPRVVLEFEMRYGFGLDAIAHHAAERGHRPGRTALLLAQLRPFGADVEILALDRYP